MAWNMSMSYGSKQLLALALLAVIQLLAAICISLQGSPFPDCELGSLVNVPLLPVGDGSTLPVIFPLVFLDGDGAPIQAAAPGSCSDGPVYQYDSVFGSFEFTSVFASQLFGIYVGIVGAKFLLGAGMFTAGTCSIVNGLMRLTTPPTSVNKGLAMLVKILEAFGTSAILVAVYTTAIAVYPRHLFLITAVLASFHILGSMFGQAFGGLVSLSGAFEISMISVGVLLILFGFIMLCFLPSLLISLLSTKTVDEERRGIFQRIHDQNSPLTTVTGYGAVQKSVPVTVSYTKRTEKLSNAEVSEKIRRASDTIVPVTVPFARSASRRSLGAERKLNVKKIYTSASFADLTSLANQKEPTEIKGGFVLPGALTILSDENLPESTGQVVRRISVFETGISEHQDEILDTPKNEPESVHKESSSTETAKEESKDPVFAIQSIWGNFETSEENLLKETLVGISQPSTSRTEESKAIPTAGPLEGSPPNLKETPVTSDSQASFKTAATSMTPTPSTSRDYSRSFQPIPGTSKDDPAEYQNAEPARASPQNVRNRRPVVDGCLQGFSKIGTILRQPVVWMILANVFVVAVYHGFFMVLLEPLLRPLNLGPVILGSVLLSYGLSFFVSSIIIGFLCHRGVHPQRFILLGASLTVTGFILIGPVFIFQTYLPLIVCGLVVFGIGMACVMVPSIVSLISIAVTSGLPKSVSTYGIVTGMWTATFALGTSIGPTFGRPLLRAIGFQWVIVILIVSELALMLFSSLFLCLQRRTDRSRPRYKLIHDPAATLVERPAPITFRH